LPIRGAACAARTRRRHRLPRRPLRPSQRPRRATTRTDARPDADRIPVALLPEKPQGLRIGFRDPYMGRVVMCTGVATCLRARATSPPGWPLAALAAGVTWITAICARPLRCRATIRGQRPAIA